jgi:hypothetical protein
MLFDFFAGRVPDRANSPDVLEFPALGKYPRSLSESPKIFHQSLSVPV